MRDQTKKRKFYARGSSTAFRPKLRNTEQVQSAEKPEILFVIGSLEIGGAERQMATLIRHLHSRTHSCYVFSLQSNGPLRGYLGNLGVPVYSGKLKKRDLLRAPWKLIPAQWKLIKIVRQLRPSVVHSLLPLATFMGALAGRMGGVPVVITSRRGLGNHQDRHLILKPLDRIANQLSYRVTVNSKAVWNDIINRDHIDESKLVLIYNAVESTLFEEALRYREKVRRELGIKPHEKVTIVVANLIPYKGHSDLLKAARQVVDQIPEAKFLLVGEDRGIQKDLERGAQDLGISDGVVFMGQRSDIAELLAASDLSVLPSHEEGFSNVILESMSAGLSVVATCVGGNPEAVVDGVTGCLVPPRNPAAMAEKIVDLLGDPERAKSWGERGRKRVKELFTIERMVEGHLKLYEGREEACGSNRTMISLGDYVRNRRF